MDYMQEYEVRDILEYIPYLDRNSWEQCRYAMYSNIQMNSTKPIKATEIIKFPWDNITDEIAKETTISKDEIERLKNKAKLIQKTQYIK